jgi:diacylglycerol kinase (ATP)
MLDPMRGIVILNPSAGSSDLLTSIEGRLVEAGFTLHETTGPGDALRTAQGAADRGFDLVVAAGGDGTITEVVGGLAASGSRACMGLLPLGTGNDLARTLAVPLDVTAALAVLLERRERAIDLIRAEVDGSAAGHAVNVAAGGFSGRVDEELTAEAKGRWGVLAYLFGAAKALPDLTGYNTTVTWDDHETEQVDALNIVVANGRSCAGGKMVAPLANPEDGLMDVVIVRSGSLVDLAGVAARLALGNYLDSDAVSLRRARSVSIFSDPPMLFNGDGELLPRGAVTFRVLPWALRVLVGPDYSPEPPAAPPPSPAA